MGILKTKKQIDVAQYSAKNSRMVKLAFGDVILINDDTVRKTKTLIFTEYIIEDDDSLTRLRTIRPFEIPYEKWFQLEDAIYPNLPDTLSRQEKYEAFLIEGIKQVIVNEGWYKGQYTLNDFE